MRDWETVPEFRARPAGSSDQVRYLMAVVRVKSQEIRQLKRQIRTLELERQVETHEVDLRLSALSTAAHVRCCMGMLAAMEAEHPELDNRYKGARRGTKTRKRL